MSNNDPFAVEETSSPSSNLSNQRHHSVGQSDPDTHCPNPMSARYRRAQRYMQAAYSTNPITFNTTLRPYWIDNSDCFWYIRDVPVNGKVTHQYRLVDANAKSNVAAFDQTRLAKVLEKEVGQAIDADQLPISDLIFNPTLQTLTFTAFDTRWLFDEHNEHCQRLDKMPEGYVISPNGKQAVFVRDYNLWIRDVATGKEHALTQDGEEFYRYASVPTLGKSLTAITDFLWSPDSSRLLTQVTDTRDVRIGMPLVKYTMPDGQVASILDSERRLSACGDEQIEAWQFLSIKSIALRFICLIAPPVPFVTLII